MGTQAEEAAAKAELERVRTENAVKAMQRDEELRKLREQQQGKMVGDAPTSGQGWPDNEVQQPSGRLDQVAGALGVGKAGDAAFAKRLLDSGNPRAGSEAPDVQAGEAKQRATGNLGGRAAKPAFER